MSDAEMPQRRRKDHVMTEHNKETETEIEVVQDEQDFTDALSDEALDRGSAGSCFFCGCCRASAEG